MFHANSRPKILQKRPMGSIKLPRLRNRIPVRLSPFGCHRLRVKPDTIPVEEFTKRFCTHILPERFHKIRYGGWLSAARRKKTLAAIREAIGVPTPEAPPEENAPPVPGFDRTLCPNCEKGHLQKTGKRILPCKARPPP